MSEEEKHIWHCGRNHALAHLDFTSSTINAHMRIDPSQHNVARHIRSILMYLKVGEIAGSSIHQKQAASRPGDHVNLVHPLNSPAKITCQTLPSNTFFTFKTSLIIQNFNSSQINSQ